MLTYGSIFAMDHDGARPFLSVIRDGIIAIRSHNEIFELRESDVLNLQRFADNQYLQEAIKMGVTLPFEIATGTADLFKGLLRFQIGVLQFASTQQLISLVWLFDFFCTPNRSQRISKFLAEELCQREFLQDYLGEVIELPKRWREKINSLITTDHTVWITPLDRATVRVWKLLPPEIEKLSLEQLLLVLKLKQNLVKGTKQACHSGMQMLFHTLPEATQDWLIARVNRRLKLNY